MAGSYEFDNTAKCLPPGMPAMMNMAYGMEVMQSKDKVTFFSELNDALRRVYLDGRKPTPKIWTIHYAGYSTGHWKETLVVETGRCTELLHRGTLHSDAMTVRSGFDSPVRACSRIDHRHRSEGADQAWRPQKPKSHARNDELRIRVRRGLDR